MPKRTTERKRKPHLEIREGVVTWHVAIVAANGECLLSSEEYASKANARRAAQQLSIETGMKIQ